MDHFKMFCNKYGGAIIGGFIGFVLAIILFCTSLYKILAIIAVIIVCIWLGHYIQQNKENVKDKVKNFVDKL